MTAACAAYLECNYAHAAALGWPAVEAFYDFTFLDQSEEGVHISVDCGKDLFTATTQVGGGVGELSGGLMRWESGCDML
jgi:hypothetical protein